MVKCHPQWLKAKALIDEGRIGEPRAASGIFCYHNTDPENVRNMADIGGGGIMDIGCYMTIFSRWMLGAEPKRAVGLIERDPGFGTDRLASAILDFGDGRRSVWTTSTQLAPTQRFTVLGTKGRLEVEIPFNATQGGAMKIYLDNGKQLADASAKAIKLPKADQYQLQGEAFSRAVTGQEPLAYGVDDAIRQMRIIDALFKSEKLGRWVKL